VSLSARLALLERGPATHVDTDAALRTYLDPLARKHDVSLDYLVEETKKILAVTPAEQTRYAAALRAMVAAAGDEWPADL